MIFKNRFLALSLRILPMAIVLPLALTSCGDSSEETSQISAAGPNACRNFSKKPDTATSTYYCGSFTYYGSETKDVQFELVNFNATQVAVLKQSIDTIMQRISDHFNQVNNLGKKPSDFVACAAKYGKTDIAPKNITVPSINAAQAAEGMISQMFHLMESHNRSGVPAKISAYSNANTGNTGRAKIGSYQIQPGLDMNVEINTDSLNFEWSDKIDVFASTLFHEWMHRAGFTHPDEVYNDTLIFEADECMRRNHKDKLSLVGLRPKTPESNVVVSQDNKPRPVPSPSSSTSMCAYEHKKDTRGGRRGNVTFLDVNGNSKSCDPSGNWQQSCKDGNGDTAEVGCRAQSGSTGGSSAAAMCHYRHKKDNRGGSKGQITTLDVNGRSKSCNRNSDWRSSCKDGNGDTEEVDCK